jgi:hypothetical protein
VKLIAIFLLVVCIYDLVRPLILINQSRVNKSWHEVAKINGFNKYAFSICVNLIAIVFFLVFLF